MSFVEERVIDPRLKEGVDLFNRGDFFECHDIFEEFWNELRGSEKLCVQGLIQTAVGCYHALNNNFKGATSQFEKASLKLSVHSPVMFGLDDTELLVQLAALREATGYCRDNPGSEFLASLIPVLRWISG